MYVCIYVCFTYLCRVFLLLQTPPFTTTNQVVEWDFGGYKSVLGSNLTVFDGMKDNQNATVSVAMQESRFQGSAKAKRSQALDYYLQNRMANVDELAVCLHTNGRIDGYKVMKTEDIPSSLFRDSAKSAKPAAPAARGSAAAPPQSPQLFSAEAVNRNGATILRFLAENCKPNQRGGSTGSYWLHREAGD